MVKRSKKRAGGLCLYLKKKHHWSDSKYKKCVTNSKKKHRRRTKSRSVNPWAVCSSAGLKKGTAKYERCVIKVKRQRKKVRVGGALRKTDKYGVPY